LARSPEFGRIVEPPAQVKADRADGNTEQERQPPASGEPVGLRQGRIQQCGGQGAEQKADDDPYKLP